MSSSLKGKKKNSDDDDDDPLSRTLTRELSAAPHPICVRALSGVKKEHSAAVSTLRQRVDAGSTSRARFIPPTTAKRGGEETAPEGSDAASSPAPSPPSSPRAQPLNDDDRQRQERATAANLLLQRMAVTAEREAEDSSNSNDTMMMLPAPRSELSGLSSKLATRAAVFEKKQEQQEQQKRPNTASSSATSPLAVMKQQLEKRQQQQQTGGKTKSVHIPIALSMGGTGRHFLSRPASASNNNNSAKRQQRGESSPNLSPSPSRFDFASPSSDKKDDDAQQEGKEEAEPRPDFFNQLLVHQLVEHRAALELKQGNNEASLLAFSKRPHQMLKEPKTVPLRNYATHQIKALRRSMQIAEEDDAKRRERHAKAGFVPMFAKSAEDLHHHSASGTSSSSKDGGVYYHQVFEKHVDDIVSERKAAAAAAAKESEASASDGNKTVNFVRANIMAVQNFSLDDELRKRQALIERRMEEEDMTAEADPVFNEKRGLISFQHHSDKSRKSNSHHASAVFHHHQPGGGLGSYVEEKMHEAQLQRIAITTSINTNDSAGLATATSMALAPMAASGQLGGGNSLSAMDSERRKSWMTTAVAIEALFRFEEALAQARGVTAQRVEEHKKRQKLERQKMQLQVPLSQVGEQWRTVLRLIHDYVYRFRQRRYGPHVSLLVRFLRQHQMVTRFSRATKAYITKIKTLQRAVRCFLVMKRCREALVARAWLAEEISTLQATVDSVVAQQQRQIAAAKSKGQHLGGFASTMPDVFALQHQQQPGLSQSATFASSMSATATTNALFAGASFLNDPSLTTVVHTPVQMVRLQVRPRPLQLDDDDVDVDQQQSGDGIPDSPTMMSGVATPRSAVLLDGSFNSAAMSAASRRRATTATTASSSAKNQEQRREELSRFAICESFDTVSIIVPPEFSTTTGSSSNNNNQQSAPPTSTKNNPSEQQQQQPSSSSSSSFSLIPAQPRQRQLWISRFVSQALRKRAAAVAQYRRERRYHREQQRRIVQLAAKGIHLSTMSRGNPLGMNSAATAESAKAATEAAKEEVGGSNPPPQPPVRFLLPSRVELQTAIKNAQRIAEKDKNKQQRQQSVSAAHQEQLQRQQSSLAAMLQTQPSTTSAAEERFALSQFSGGSFRRGSASETTTPVNNNHNNILLAFASTVTEKPHHPPPPAAAASVTAASQAEEQQRDHGHHVAPQQQHSQHGPLLPPASSASRAGTMPVSRLSAGVGGGGGTSRTRRDSLEKSQQQQKQLSRPTSASQPPPHQHPPTAAALVRSERLTDAWREYIAWHRARNKPVPRPIGADVRIPQVLPDSFFVRLLVGDEMGPGAEISHLQGWLLKNPEADKEERMRKIDEALDSAQVPAAVVDALRDAAAAVGNDDVDDDAAASIVSSLAGGAGRSVTSTSLGDVLRHRKQQQQQQQQVALPSTGVVRSFSAADNETAAASAILDKHKDLVSSVQQLIDKREWQETTGEVCYKLSRDLAHSDVEQLKKHGVGGDTEEAEQQHEVEERKQEQHERQVNFKTVTLPHMLHSWTFEDRGFNRYQYVPGSIEPSSHVPRPPMQKKIEVLQGATWEEASSVPAPRKHNVVVDGKSGAPTVVCSEDMGAEGKSAVGMAVAVALRQQEQEQQQAPRSSRPPTAPARQKQQHQQQQQRVGSAATARRPPVVPLGQQRRSSAAVTPQSSARPQSAASAFTTRPSSALSIRSTGSAAAAAAGDKQRPAAAAASPSPVPVSPYAKTHKQLDSSGVAGRPSTSYFRQQHEFEASRASFFAPRSQSIVSLSSLNGSGGGGGGRSAGGGGGVCSSISSLPRSSPRGGSAAQQLLAAGSVPPPLSVVALETHGRFEAESGRKRLAR